VDLAGSHSAARSPTISSVERRFRDERYRDRPTDEAGVPPPCLGDLGVPRREGDPRRAPRGGVLPRRPDEPNAARDPLAHVGDLLDWAVSIARGKQTWHDSEPASWEEQVERFFAGIGRLDEALVQGGESIPAEGIFQGPIADAFTHVGQVAMLRRVAGSPVRGENYFRAEIRAGRLGPEQAPPRREFD